MSWKFRKHQIVLNQRLERLNQYCLTLVDAGALCIEQDEAVSPAHGGEDSGALLTGADDAEVAMLIMAENAAQEFVAPGSFSKLLIACCRQDEGCVGFSC